MIYIKDKYLLYKNAIKTFLEPFTNQFRVRIQDQKHHERYIGHLYYVIHDIKLMLTSKTILWNE